VHFWWLVKKDIREPLFYAVVLALLLGVRLFYKLRQMKLKIDRARKVKLSAAV